MRMPAIALSALLPLFACNFAAPGLTPIQVDVPVAVPCHQTLPPHPAWMMDVTSPDADIADQVKAALIELNQRESYEDDLRTQILACK